MMEKDCPDIIQVSIQSEETAPRLQRPNFDLIVVSSRYEKWLSFMEIYASNWTIVLFESIDQRAHSVIP